MGIFKLLIESSKERARNVDKVWWWIKMTIIQADKFLLAEGGCRLWGGSAAVVVKKTQLFCGYCNTG